MTVYLKTITYEKDADQVADMKWKEGHNEVFIDNARNESVLKRINHLLPAAQKTLQESRGYVISDYQDVLESNWVNELKNEFTINVDEAVLSSLFQ